MREVRALNHTEICFLRFLACALKGVPASDSAGLSQEEWQQLFSLAKQHHVLPLVLEAVCALPDVQDSELLPSVRQAVRKQVFLQTQKTAETLQLLNALEAAGVRPLVVKGIVCRSLYPMPDHRFSSDEDLLIAPGDLDICRQVFEQFGLVTEFSPERQKRDYEIPYRQPEGVLYIELHRHLFPPESDAYGYLNQFFTDAASRAVCHKISGVTVYSLDHTDHLFYLICHALKHFLHSGFGIRQVCDILMYAQTFHTSVDWPLLLENCRRIHAYTFAASLFRIGCRHLGFGPEIAPTELTAAEVDEMPMLEDLIQAGIYGSSSESRLHSSNITLDAMASRVSSRKEQNALFLSLFPPARKLEGRYPWLKEHPWLLPAAWARRAGTYCRDSLLQRPLDAADSLRLGNTRISLLKFYGLLDEPTKRK